jgi:REP element-mobilizing transposase RayT
MPDHLHCIWTLPPGDSDFSIRWNLINDVSHTGRATALSLPGITALDEGTMVDKPKGRYDI